MKLEHLIVEIRDANLARLGQVPGEILKLKATPLHNAVGGWELTLPAGHELAESLRQPGAGIVVSDARTNDVLISGPLTEPELAVVLDDVAGSVKFTGISDEHVLADRLCYPQPSNPDTRTQNADHDTRTGKAESVVHAYVNANVGPAAPEARRHPRLQMGTNNDQGEVVTKSARFETVGEITAAVSNTAGLRQRVVQRGDVLYFETSPIIDRSLDIRLDTANNTLSGFRLKTAPPGVTHAIVGAQEETLDRVFATVTTPESIQAGEAWGRRIEKFVNQAYALDEDEWTQSARELLAEQGMASTNVQAVPVDDETMVFGSDWNVGDYVSVVAEGREYRSQVTGLIISADENGVRLGMVLGDVTAFNDSLSTNKAVTAVESRVSVIERNLAAGNSMKLLYNYTISGVGPLGPTQGNGVSGTMHQWGTGGVPATARTIQVHFDTNAIAEANAAAVWELYIRLRNPDGNWVKIDNSRVHNMGRPSMSLGASMSGWLDLGTATGFDLAANINVDPGGAPVHTTYGNFNVTFFE